MRVLHVITSLLAGGAEKLMVDLLPIFREMGIAVELAVFNAIDTPFMQTLDDKGITVHRFAPRGCNVYSPMNLLKLHRLVKRGHYDIVHTHNTAPQLFAAIAGGGQNTKLVTTEHNTDNRRRHIPVFKNIDRWMYGRYDWVICISQKTADNLVVHVDEGVANKISVIPNGVDLMAFNEQPRNVAKHGEVVVTMVAGFRPQKDQDTVINAAMHLPERFRVRLIGDGPRRQQLQQLASENGVGNRVEFLGVRSDIPEQLRESDIIVLSSHYEGLSLSSIEAMASGRPLVASDVPGLQEIVGGFGILFPEGDDKALSDIILRLSMDDFYYMETARQCQLRAASYDVSNTASRYAELYNACMTF